MRRNRLMELKKEISRGGGDYFFDAFPIVLSIIVFGIGAKLDHSTRWPSIWLGMVGIAILIAGLWRALNTSGLFKPAIAAVLGLGIGFGCASGPATVYADLAGSTPVKESFYLDLAYISMLAYVAPSLAMSFCEGFVLSSSHSLKEMRRRLRLLVLFVSILIALSPLLTILV